MIFKCVLVDFRHDVLDHRKSKCQAFWIKGPIPILMHFLPSTHDVSVTRSCCSLLPNTSNTYFLEIMEKACVILPFISLMCRVLR
jgi:hypothetical protein